MRWTLTIFYIIICCYSSAQPSNRANIWYFGQNAGLDFNSGEPRVLTDGQINTDEGSAVISDENGNLLFYTDGETIWNRNHEVMPNGEGLKGSFTSTQSAIIVPQPGSNRLFYVFTTASQGGADGFNYNIVDITLDGGLGDVITKNVQLYTPTTEKLTAVHHENGRDVWVITHKWESDEFYVYLVTENGLNETPVISAAGSRHEFSTGNAIGQMKASTNGNLIGLNLWSDLITEVFEFNNSSGTINLIRQFLINTGFPNEAGIHISGLEISQNSSYMYISEEASSLFSPQSIYQLDIHTGHQVKVEEAFMGGGLQIAPDGKIYCVNAGRQELITIEKPNLPENHPEFIVKKINISPQRNSLHLPNFIQSYFAVEDPEMIMPNVFTPNNDGLNEVFQPIQFERVESFRMKILDRAGQTIYQTSDDSIWWDGGEYPEGIYYWHMLYEGVNGFSGNVKGWVQLIR